MRLTRVLPAIVPLVLAMACAEAPECVDFGSGEVVLDCSAGKVPVCGSDPDELYDQNGALLPVPPASVANGSCDGIDGPCRPRPVCGASGEAATCANGAAPLCRLGRVRTVTVAPMPMPDAGGGEEDAGSEEVDAGESTDAGASTDAGETADAGESADAGETADAG